MESKIIKKIASIHFGVTVKDLEGKCRKREFVIARQSAMALILIKTKLSLSQVGKRFGNRDHSTVIHARETVRDLIIVDKTFKRNWEAFCQKVELDETHIFPQLIYKNGEFKAA